MIHAHTVGTLGRNSEVKKVGDNDLTTFSIATTSGFGDKKVTEWVECSIFGNRGVKLANYLVKGQQVVVHGELTVNRYTAKDGTAKSSLRMRVQELDLVGGKKDGEKSEDSPSYAHQAPANGGGGVDFDDSIPFASMGNFQH